MRVIEIMKGLSCIHTEDLEVLEHLLFLLEVNYEFLVVFVTVGDLYAVTVLILYLMHG